MTRLSGRAAAAPIAAGTAYPRPPWPLANRKPRPAVRAGTCEAIQPAEKLASLTTTSSGPMRAASSCITRAGSIGTASELSVSARSAAASFLAFAASRRHSGLAPSLRITSRASSVARASPFKATVGRNVRPSSEGSTSRWMVACSTSGSDQLWLVFCPTLQPHQSTTSALRKSSSESVVPRGFRTPAELGPVSSTDPLPEKLVTTTASRRSPRFLSSVVAREARTPPPATMRGRRAFVRRSAAAATVSAEATGR